MTPPTEKNLPMRKPSKLPSLANPPRMLHHEPYRESWYDVALAIVLGIVLGLSCFQWLAK